MTAELSCPILYALESILDPLDLRRLFAHPEQPLEIELGSGDGSFLLHWSQAHPGRNFIAVERLLGRLRKIDRKGRRAGLRNLRAIQIESSYFLQYLAPAGVCQALHLYFPDPWPKRRHQRHRLVNERFPHLLRRVLVPGGRVYLRTDNAPYFEQMREVLAGAPDFLPVETPLDLAGVITDFEAEFNARGIPTLRAAYQLGD
jgi:tRNA (guanine-N7-)-methyltransferase